MTMGVLLDTAGMEGETEGTLDCGTVEGAIQIALSGGLRSWEEESGMLVSFPVKT